MLLVALHHRFDRGALHNCVQFWTEPAQDWWSAYDEGDKVNIALE
jgi:hypothetical protein